MRVQAVRGAVFVEENSKKSITAATQKMMKELVERNKIREEDMVSVQFTVTEDLTAFNPATAFRRLGYDLVPLFCSLEPPFNGSAERVVRVLLTSYTDDSGTLTPVYTNGAEKLRPDLGKTGDERKEGSTE